MCHKSLFPICGFSFCLKHLLYFDEIPLIITLFLFIYLAFCILRNLCLSRGHKKFSCIFSSRSFIVLDLTFISVIYEFLLCVPRYGLGFIFTCGCSITIRWEDGTCAIQLPWQLCQKLIDPLSASVYGLYLIPLNSLSFFQYHTVWIIVTL